MKALTIQQPYASLIADGEKWVENRKWWTGYRGPLAIHAGKGTRYLDSRELSKYPTSVVIAVAQLEGCVYLQSVIGRNPLARDQVRCAGVDVEEFLSHEHTEGPWCWILRDVRKLAPAPATSYGQQGLWEWEERRPR